MIEANPEYYQQMQKKIRVQARLANVFFSAFFICSVFAFHDGAIAGWPWLIGALVALAIALTAQIERAEAGVLVQIYLASAK